MKNKDKKKGCIKSGLLAILILVLVGITTFLILSNALRTEQDTRLIEVLGREYTMFSDKITDTRVDNFNAKINSKMTNITEPLIIDNQLNTIAFYSSNTRVQNSLVLNNFDLAVLANYTLSNSIYNANTASAFIKVISLDLSTRTAENEVDFVAVLQINLSNSALAFGFSAQKLPETIYVTLSSTYSLVQPQNSAVMSVALQVNRLIGEDNAYAVEKLLLMFGKTDDYAKTMASTPFAIIRECCSNWNAIFSAKDNTFVFE